MWKSYPHFLWITYEISLNANNVEKISTIIGDNSLIMTLATQK